MKGKVLILGVCILALFAYHAQASVFSGSGGSSLQSLFNGIGYDNIDVADYQTDLNFSLQGMMEFQLLSKSGSPNLSFGVLESRQRWWGTQYSHERVFGSGSTVGSTGMYSADNPNSAYGFYVSKRDPDRWWRTNNYYSYSPFVSARLGRLERGQFAL